MYHRMLICKVIAVFINIPNTVPFFTAAGLSFSLGVSGSEKGKLKSHVGNQDRHSNSRLDATLISSLELQQN